MLNILLLILLEGPGKGSDSGLHGVLMHGDDSPEKEHTHLKFGPDKKPEKEGPGLNAEHQLDGIVSKTKEDDGGKDASSHQEPCKSTDCPNFDGNKVSKVQHHKESKASDPDSLLHGSDHSHDPNHHAQEKKQTEKKNFVPFVQDPHEMIHNAEIGRVPKVEQKDYEEWKKKEKEKEEKEEDKGLLQRFSLGFISDSFLTDLEALKRRYLPKYWTKDVKMEQKKNELQPKKDHLEEDMVLVGGTQQQKKKSLNNNLHIKKVHDEE